MIILFVIIVVAMSLWIYLIERRIAQLEEQIGRTEARIKDVELDQTITLRELEETIKLFEKRATSRKKKT